MKRFVALIATAILASLLLVVPTTPASADTGACFGFGNAYVPNGLYYPILGPKRTGSFGFYGGTCVTEQGQKTLGAFGIINGWCGLSSGVGDALGGGSAQPQNFWFVGIGGVLIVGGHITGVAIAVPFPPATPLTPGESCLPTTDGANNFLVAGAVVKNHVVPQNLHDGDPKLPPDLPPPFPLCPSPPTCPPV